MSESKDPISKTHPEIAKEWLYEKNGDLTPDDVTYGSGRKVWWKCNKGHEWEAVIKKRKIGQGCPYCSGKRVTINTCLLTTDPSIAKLFHPNKNGKIKVTNISRGSDKDVWWKCEKGHEFKRSVANMISLGYCSKCEKYDKIFAFQFPKIAKDWNYDKNNKNPDDYYCNSNIKVWWKCDNNHELIQRIQVRIGCEGCYKCKTPKPREIKSGHSLAEKYPKIAKLWHPTKNGDVKPSNVSFGSEKIYWWRCLNNPEHIWERGVGHMGYRSYCPFCDKRKSYSEISIKWLNDIMEETSIFIKHAKNGGEFSIKLLDKRCYRFDGYHEESKTVYSFLGCFWHGHPKKHCRDIKSWHKKNKNPVSKKSFKELYGKTFERFDHIKKLGYSIIYIWECEYHKNIGANKY